jgi:large subunit ribosomal protein L23
MSKFHYLDTIISPNVTEKSTALSELNKVVFKVHKGASKNSIKKSIEKTFKVNVIKINTINMKGKTKLVKNKKTYKPGYKKAVITLKKGQSIDLATGI